MCGLQPFDVSMLMLMSELASCIKHVCFVNKVCVLFSLKNKLFPYFSYTSTLIPSKLRKPPYSHCCQHLSASLWGQAHFNAFLASARPLFSPAATGRGLYDDPFAHKTNASQFRHVASPSTFINSRLSTLRRNTIFKSVPVENSEEYRVTACCPSYAVLNLSGTGKMLSKQRPCFNLQIGAASFL